MPLHFIVDFMSFWSAPTISNAPKDPVMVPCLLNVLWKILKSLGFFSGHFLLSIYCLIFFSVVWFEKELIH